MRNIWIDCDPGIDDALMLAVAGANRDQLNILGISAVAGNQSTDKVTKNAIELSSMLNMEDVPVSRGAIQPLLKDYVDAGEVHGDNGLGGIQLPETDKKETEDSAIVRMYSTIMNLKENEKITLVSTGPMTDLALLIRTCPKALAKVEQIVLMGGCSDHGNTTPYAEYNCFADPEAAKIVFNSNLPIVMCGLDITEKCTLHKSNLPILASCDHYQTSILAAILDFYANCEYYKDYDSITVHDACTIIYLLKPELFSGKMVSVEVECNGEKAGQTICTEGGNVLLLNNADLTAFENYLMETLLNL